MKKSFVLYESYGRQLELLDFEQSGRLLKAIFAHEYGGKQPALDALTMMLYLEIESTLDRDRKQYDLVCQKRADAGRQGGRPRSDFSCSEKKANAFKNENENENENVDEKERVPSAPAAVRRARGTDPTEKIAERERFYSVRKQRAEDEAEKNLEKARGDVEFRDAEREMKDAEISLARAEARGEDPSALRKLLYMAKKRRCAAMARLHFAESDFLPRYACKKCSDTGFLPNGRGCDCFLSSG